MSRMSAREIYEIAREAGFSEQQAVTWTAIALAESGGDPTAVAPESDSRGLWQIRVDSPHTRGNLYDPLTNARAAYALSDHGTNPDLWSVTDAESHSPPRYQRYLQEVIDAVRDSPSAIDGERPAKWDAVQPEPGDLDAELVFDGEEGAPVSASDRDRDGLTDYFEAMLGTDPAVTDSGRDGLYDNRRISLPGADPRTADSDGQPIEDNVDADDNGLADSVEVQTGRDSLGADTDLDILKDGLEYALGGSSLSIDSDGDGITDAYEVQAGTGALGASRQPDADTCQVASDDGPEGFDLP
jgi:hypothetical protein